MHAVSPGQSDRMEWMDESYRSQAGVWVEEREAVCANNHSEETPSPQSASPGFFSSS